MTFLRLQRRLAVVLLAGVTFVVLVLHVVQVHLDTSQIPFAVPGRRRYELAEEDFAEFPDGSLDRIKRIPSSTTTARNATVKGEESRSSQFENKKGTYKPSLWPISFNNHDRIIEQLEYQLDPSAKRKPKVIFTLDTSLYSTDRLKQDKCAVQDCILTHQYDQMAKADVVVFTSSNQAEPSTTTRARTDQIWMSFMLEAPPNSPIFSPRNRHINWTATYRTDSTIVAPYERFVQFANITKLPEKPPRNYALGKKKKAAWFVSNCVAGNGRSQYVKELQKYIEVDIYGGCGRLQCQRADAASCFQMLNKDYKFYMSFENSNCKDYITEKLYWNALYNDIVPVVMGAAPEDYRKVAPPHSYIHVDDFASPRELAAYLHKLDANDILYNEYFRWKGTGHFINTKFWCRVCAMAHAADRHAMWYEDVKRWWSGKDVCIYPQSGRLWASWRDMKRRDTDRDGTNIRHVTL